MPLATLHDHKVHELKDLYSAERQLVQVLPRKSKNASSDELKTAIENHLAETEDRVSRLEQIQKSFGESPRGQQCEGVEGIIAEGKSLLNEKADPDVMDARIIVVAAQTVDPCEIATYGAVCEYARPMGHTEALQLLEPTLEEEKNTDRVLNGIADSAINALAERDNGDGDGDGAASPPRAATSSSRREQGS